jgi:hypothetical protein
MSCDSLFLIESLPAVKTTGSARCAARLPETTGEVGAD